MNGRQKGLLGSLYRAALRGVDPGRAVERALAEEAVSGPLRGAREVGVFAVGKAAASMLRGARGIASRGLVILPRGYAAPKGAAIDVVFSSHPEPDRSSLRAARRAIDFFASFGREDAILCLVSGGTSALLALPRAGWTLEREKRALRRLVARGASILELNRLRTRASAVKGGGLGRRTRATLVTLVLSDVPGDRPRLVGSGPTVRGLRRDRLCVIGTNALGLEAAAEEARRRGLVPVRCRERLSGEACEAGERIARRLKRLRPGAAMLAGGETTVRLGRAAGRGGRSLELALGAAAALSGIDGWCLLAAGSDGKDGSSSAAGAFADGSTLERAKRRGLDPAAALARHATDPFFRALGDLFETGPTGTNVADWAFAVRL